MVLRQDLLENLRTLADNEGRTLSNLCAHLLEKAYQQQSRPEERH